MASTEGDLPHNGVSPDAGGSDPLPACCDSGCIICVLDYPELFRSALDPSAVGAPVTDSTLDEMFEAILRAESLLESIDADETKINTETEGDE
jgi:hypothetical protein